MGINMENNYIEEKSYLKAKKEVEKIKAYYTHLAVYLIVNLVISAMVIKQKIEEGETLGAIFLEFDLYAVWVFWGIGIAIHTFKMFGIQFFLGKNWEENKIKELIENNKS